MAANTSPIFPVTPRVSWGILNSPETNKNGVGDVVTIFEAGPYGSRIDEIRVVPLGTNNENTVLRLFVNNGETNSVAVNNSLVHELTIEATVETEKFAQPIYDVTVVKNTVETISPIRHLPAGYKIMATIGTACPSGLQVTVFGGDY